MGDSSLIFDGTLELCDPDGHVSPEDYWFEALTDASFGDPQPIEVAMASLMRDGAIVEKTGDENREAVFLVKVKGADSAALDAGVAALHRATGKRTTLLFTPPDGYGDPRTWDVETSNLLESNGFDDLAYVLRNEQVFRLRLVCLPFRRGTTLIVDDAGTPPSTGGTLLLNCESTTGWAAWATGTYSPAFSVDAVIYAEGAGSLKSRMIQWTVQSVTEVNGHSFDKVTGLSLDTDTGGYLSIKVRVQYEDGADDTTTPGLQRLWVTTASGGEVEVETFVAVDRDDLGFVRYVWPVDAGLTVTELRFQVFQRRLGDPGAARPYTWYDDVELLPAATTDHQIVKQLTVEGSARTTGSLHIAAPSDVLPLGRVLAITAPTNALPAGFQPDGARWITQGTTTSDPTAIEGIYYTPNTTTYSSAAGKPIFDVPVGMLTAGPYTIVGLIMTGALEPGFGVQAQLNVDGTLVGPTSAAEVTPVGLTDWQFVTVGTVYLPPLPVQSADATTYVRLLFKGAKMANVYMIPAWQVGGRSVADFSIVDCGDGTVEPGGSSSNLWLDSPSTSQPQGGWWRGPTAGRANAQSAWPDAKKPGIHTFNAGGLSAFLISTEAAGPTLTLEYYDRYI